jgi:thiol:disulfide interchange protein DsbD
VVLSFWVLSGFLLGLREGFLGGGAGSADVSWGYQLQNPWVVWGLMLIMFLLALNMYGVFEIGTSATGVGGGLAQKQGAAGTFFSGVLATVVATPCSAPFLGAALGATFALPPATFMLSFTAMAIGLAFPYLLLSLFPQLVEKLPRPGPWMESFKQAMSFLLFATAGYLLWVFAIQIDVTRMLSVVIGLTSIAVAGWIYGRWCSISRSKKTRMIGLAVVLVFAVFGVKASMPPGEETLVWEKWSKAAVEDALDADRPVFVDFTAAWCATCQVNKGRAYSEKVQKLFENYDVVLLKADKTKPNAEIDAAVSELGRAAIPVNVLYIPGEETPQLTSELFDADYMVEFLNKHLQDRAGAE